MSDSLRDDLALRTHLKQLGEQAFCSEHSQWPDSEDTTQHWGSSRACRILIDIVIGILEKKQKLEIDKQDIEESFAVANELVCEWRYAIARNGGKNATRFQLWYDLLLDQSIEESNCISRETSRPDIENVTGQYLDLNIRSKLAEKELLRALIGVEYIDFQSQTHGSWKFQRECGQNWFMRLFRIDAISKGEKENFKRLSWSMRDTYGIADALGLLPIQHLRQKINSAHDLGVVWPGALYALISRLEDEAVEYL